MDDDNYDEFGNYIGPELRFEEEEEEDESVREEGERAEWDVERGWEEPAAGAGEGRAYEEPEGAYETAVVLHEDKQLYPEAEEVFGDAEVRVETEDTRPITEPIIASTKRKIFSQLERETPQTTFTVDFMGSLLEAPALIRNVALVGHLHHGKTSFMDVLVEQTHDRHWDPSRQVRYTDARKDEQQRGLSIKSTPMSLVLPNTAGKHYLLNIMDVPGHPNFGGEMTAALRVADGVVLVVDAIEGVLMGTERAIEHALRDELPLVLVINKVDRLVLELKMRPADAFMKLRHTIAEVNRLMVKHSHGLAPYRLDPREGHGLFAAAQHAWMFSLHSFAAMFAARFPQAGMDPAKLARKLWGDWFYDVDARRMTRRPESSDMPRTFVHFVLEPIYKVYAQTLGEEPQDLAATLESLGVQLRRSELQMDPQPLLKLIFARWLGRATGLVDMVAQHVPSAAAAGERRAAELFAGEPDGEVARAIRACDPLGPLTVNVVKLYSNADASGFLAFGRVFSGTLERGQRVQVIGDRYTEGEGRAIAERDVEGLSLGQGRYTMDLTRALPGNWVLIEGVAEVLDKTGTLTSQGVPPSETFTRLQFMTTSVMKLAVEPLNPSELPKLQTALQSVNRSYPLCQIRQEESGERVILGTGEVMMDCLMHDLREMYSSIEVKVSDPFTAFRETVIDTSSLPCIADTANGKNRLTMIAEPLEVEVARGIEEGRVSMDDDPQRRAEFFVAHDWDALAARRVWAFGPDERGPNVLLDDTLSFEVPQERVAAVRDFVVQGFQWGCRDRPLCDEPVRNVKFKLIDASLSANALERGMGQVIPTARRVVYSSFLMATPRMMEPVYAVEIQAPADAVAAVFNVISRRRGAVDGKERPIPGSPFYLLKAYIPVMDSFGFETDLRVHTQGQAFCLQAFDHWAVVPGDPLDRSIELRPLEPSPPMALAREFMLKMRRRKGLPEDVTVQKYFDESMMLELERHRAELAGEDEMDLEEGGGRDGQ